jgi:hypothetical protein
VLKRNKTIARKAASRFYSFNVYFSRIEFPAQITFNISKILHVAVDQIGHKENVETRVREMCDTSCNEIHVIVTSW